MTTTPFALKKKLDPYAPSGDPNATVNADWGPGGDPTQAWSGASSNEASNASAQPQATVPNDPYTPRLNDVANQMLSAYQPQKVGTGRLLLGALVGGITKNPQLAGLVTGATQRRAQTGQLGNEYSLLSDIISRNRAAQTAGLANADTASQIGLRGAQTNYYNDRANNVDVPKPTPQEQIFQGYLAKHNGDAVAANEEMEADAQGAKPPKALPNMKAVTIQLPGGKKAAGKTDDQGNILMDDNTPAPKGTMIYQQPNYGQLVLPTKTQTLMGPDSLPHDYSYNPQTQKFDVDQGISSTGAYGHEMEQAGAVGRAGNDLIGQLKDPANRAILGKLSSYVKQGTLGTPLADKQAANLSAQLKTFAALQPAMHGFKSRSAQEAFENIIGGLAQNPDATIGSIEGILKTAGAINPSGGGTAPAAGATGGGFKNWKAGQTQ